MAFVAYEGIGTLCSVNPVLILGPGIRYEPTLKMRAACTGLVRNSLCPLAMLIVAMSNTKREKHIYRDTHAQPDFCLRKQPRSFIQAQMVLKHWASRFLKHNLKHKRGFVNICHSCQSCFGQWVVLNFSVAVPPPVIPISNHNFRTSTTANLRPYHKMGDGSTVEGNHNSQPERLLIVTFTKQSQAAGEKNTSSHGIMVILH